MTHFTSIHDLDDADMSRILERGARPDTSRPLAGRIIAMAFFEPSTRTRLSFEAAAHRLGATVIGFSDAGSTSSAKGETLEDAIRVLAGYADAIVLRHPESGAATRAAAVSDVPVINAGDGTGEHPTQTLVDLFTMQQALGSLQGKRVALLGDLANGRTVHSLAPALTRFGAAVVQVPAPGLEHPDGLDTLELAEAAATCDVLYCTRVQKERASQGKAPVVDAALLAATQSKALIMHPLPRVDELSTDVDALAGARYFEQARNGVPIRMAVLAYALGVL